jgi:hypothetical protein
MFLFEGVGVGAVLGEARGCYTKRKGEELH